MDQPTGNNDENLPDHNAAQFPDYDYAQFPYDNTAQLPDHNYVQVPSHNDALALDPTLGQYSFGGGDLLAAPGLGQTTTPAEDQYDFGQNQQGMDLPQKYWDPMYDGGSLLNPDQAPQQPFSDQATIRGTPIVAPQSFLGNNGYQAAGQQQTQEVPAGHYTHPDGRSQDTFPPNFRRDYLQPPPPMWSNHPPHQQAYPGYQPAYTSPHTPMSHGTPLSFAPDQQNDPVAVETAQKSKPRKRKIRDEEQEAEQDEEKDKDANKKSKAAKGVETKARKGQDTKDRSFLIGLRDEAASRVYEIAAQHISAGAERAVFEHEWNIMKELNAEIDRHTEDYISWNGTRPNHRKSDRAVPERKQEED